MEPAIAATGAETGLVAGKFYQNDLAWQLAKHQIRLTAGFLKNRIISGIYNPEPAHGNILVSPSGLLSALASIIADTPDTETSLRLSQTVLCPATRTKLDANLLLEMFCHLNKNSIKHNSGTTLAVHAYRYNDYRCNRCDNCNDRRNNKNNNRNNLTNKETCKYYKKYQTIAKQLSLTNEDGKPSLQALKQINEDISQANCDLPQISTHDFVSMIAPNDDHRQDHAETLLASTIDIRGIWSKPFEVHYGEFRRIRRGDRVKTPLLYRYKSSHYYRDERSRSSAVAVNFTHEGNLSLVMILPDDDNPVESVLDYSTLKRTVNALFDSDSRVCNVRLTMPPLKLIDVEAYRRPIEALAFDDILDSAFRLNKSGTQKQRTTTIDAKMCSTKIDESIALWQRVSFEIDDRYAEPCTARPKRFSFTYSSHVHREVEFCADRPFVFLVVTAGIKQILLAGVCEDPTTMATTATIVTDEH